MKALTGVCIFGGYARGYARNEVVQKGLAKLGIPVRSCYVSHKVRVPFRYFGLAYKYFRAPQDFSVIYVPEFRHKDVPAAWLLGKLTRKRVVFDPLVSRYDTRVHDRGDARDRSWQAWHNKNIDRLSMALADIVLADTQAHADYYTRELGINPGKIRLLPVGFDEDIFHPDVAPAPPEPPAKTGPPVYKVLFYGTYLPLHGIQTILEAAGQLRSHPEIRFELIGGGQTRPEAETYVEQEQLTNVQFSSRVPIEDLATKIASADICLGIFGRTRKALRVVPNKVYQCLAMGKAVITARSEAIQEHFQEGEHICLVPPGDAGALAEKILYIQQHPEEHAAIARRAAEHLMQHYSSERIADGFVQAGTGNR